MSLLIVFTARDFKVTSKITVVLGLHVFLFKQHSCVLFLLFSFFAFLFLILKLYYVFRILFICLFPFFSLRLFLTFFLLFLRADSLQMHEL